MPLLSNMELRGLEKGKEIGKAIGQACFGSVPEIEALTQITNLRQLDDLFRLAATVENPEAFQTELAALI